MVSGKMWGFRIPTLLFANQVLQSGDGGRGGRWAEERDVTQGGDAACNTCSVNRSLSLRLELSSGLILDHLRAFISVAVK